MPMGKVYDKIKLKNILAKLVIYNIRKVAIDIRH
jgi:hypothetical protein